MDVMITAMSGDEDDLRSLREWLVMEDELRGRVDLATPPPREGVLGSVADVLVAALGSGGAVTVLISVLISWIRHRTQDVSFEVVREDGSSIKVDAKRVRGTDTAALQELVTAYAQSLEGKADRVEGRE
jgi:Effector Associated Constant Component 1